MSLTITPVSDHKQLDQFIDVSWVLHGHDLTWVPPLRVSVKQLLDTEKHPFYKHASLQCWIAYRNQRPVGRIAAILNHAHNQCHQEQVGFWGFFESEHSFDVANALFQALENWFLKLGITIIRGPVNPSTNYECGLQVSAFDTQPFVMMPQNPSYYADLVESLGYRKAKDLHAWLLRVNSPNFLEVLEKKASKLIQIPNLTVRSLNARDYDRYFSDILSLYNDAWENNWGFTMMSPEEFYCFTLDMKSILTKNSIWIVEVDGEMAAFGVMIPDINQVLIDIRNGKLFPTGIFKLLWNTKITKGLMKRVRIPVLGVRRKFKHLPLGVLLYVHLLRAGYRMGVQVGECSWVLEDNKPMRTALRLMKAEHYKTYRIYEKVSNMDLSSG